LTELLSVCIIYINSSYQRVTTIEYKKYMDIHGNYLKIIKNSTWLYEHSEIIGDLATTIGSMRNTIIVYFAKKLKKRMTTTLRR